MSDPKGLLALSEGSQRFFVRALHVLRMTPNSGCVPTNEEEPSEKQAFVPGRRLLFFGHEFKSAGCPWRKRDRREFFACLLFYEFWAATGGCPYTRYCGVLCPGKNREKRRDLQRQFQTNRHSGPRRAFHSRSQKKHSRNHRVFSKKIRDSPDRSRRRGRGTGRAGLQEFSGQEKIERSFRRNHGAGRIDGRQCRGGIRTFCRGGPPTHPGNKDKQWVS